MTVRFWTDDRKSLLTELWQGHTLEEIAGTLGTSMGGVKTMAQIMRLGPPYKPGIGRVDDEGWPALSVGDWPKITGPTWDSVPDATDQLPSYGYIPTRRFRPAPSPGCAALLAMESAGAER